MKEAEFALEKLVEVKKLIQVANDRVGSRKSRQSYRLLIRLSPCSDVEAEITWVLPPIVR